MGVKRHHEKKTNFKTYSSNKYMNFFGLKMIVSILEKLCEGFHGMRIGNTR